MGSYRGRFDIIADMLRVISEGAKKTRIMYQSNLNYTLLTKYLTEIRKAYLVRFERGRRCYVLTQKGKEFLVRYVEYSKRNRHVEKQIADIRNKVEVLEDLCSTKRV